MCYSFRVRRPDRLLEIRTAAYLAAQGFSQKEIAETLGVSQPGVSRLVKQAIAVGCLKETSAYTFVSDDIPEEQLQAIQTAAVPTELTTELRRLGDRLGVSVPAVRVYHSGGDERVDIDQRIARFASFAARRMRELLQRSSLVGVSWGGTLEAIVRGMDHVGHVPGPAPRFIPICGEPLGLPPTTRSASSLAARLTNVFGSTTTSLSLAAVPALVPIKLSPDDVEAVRRFIAHVESYRTIFGKGRHDEALIGRVDTIITSIGDSKQGTGCWDERFAETAGVSYHTLLELVVGDIAGVLIPKREHERAPLIEKVRTRWFGIDLEHIEACAERAFREPGNPGVVVASVGRNKVECLFELIRRGVVNEALLDHELSEALLVRLRQSATEDADEVDARPPSRRSERSRRHPR